MPRETIILVNAVLALVLVGVLVVFSAGSALALDGKTELHYTLLMDHLIRVGIGLAFMLIAARFDYHHYRSRSVLWILMGFAALLLVLVLVQGFQFRGASRWLQLGGIRVQPSDMAKLVVILVLAVKLSENQERITSFWRGFVPPMVLAGFFMALIVFERDIGTPVVIGATAVLMVFMAGARLWHIGMSIGPAVLMVGLYIVFNEHAQRRIAAFRDPLTLRNDEGFQLTQSLWAFSRGGLWGQGLGAGQGKLGYIYASVSDFAFAIWGEEMGLAGTLLVAALFALFIIMAIRIAANAPDLLGSLIAGGIGSLITFQAVLNMAITTGLLPTKGLTLPFISYGGTATVFYLTMVGVLVNVGSQIIQPAHARTPA